jgi:mutator protein MutT
MKNHAAIILHDGNKILFVQRAATKKSLPNIWAFPSGTMEEGETADMTIVREAKEELQVDVVVEKTLATVELPDLNARLHFGMCAMQSEASLIPDPGEIQALRWMTLPEFFNEFTDDQIGHGLIYLRKHPEIWKADFA